MIISATFIIKSDHFFLHPMNWTTASLSHERNPILTRHKTKLSSWFSIYTKIAEFYFCYFQLAFTVSSPLVTHGIQHKDQKALCLISLPGRKHLPLDQSDAFPASAVPFLSLVTMCLYSNQHLYDTDTISHCKFHPLFSCPAHSIFNSIPHPIFNNDSFNFILTLLQSQFKTII